MTRQTHCSNLTDGHRAAATHKVASTAFGMMASRPTTRLFCEPCARLEVEVLGEEGFDAHLTLHRSIPPVTLTAAEAAAFLRPRAAARQEATARLTSMRQAFFASRRPAARAA